MGQRSGVPVARRAQVPAVDRCLERIAVDERRAHVLLPVAGQAVIVLLRKDRRKRTKRGPHHELYDPQRGNKPLADGKPYFLTGV